MKKIFKYKLPVEDLATVEMPQGAEILSVGTQGPAELFVWALVDPEAPVGLQYFNIRGTGHDADGDLGRFVGSVTMSIGLVFHVFESHAYHPAPSLAVYGFEVGEVVECLEYSPRIDVRILRFDAAEGPRSVEVARVGGEVAFWVAPTSLRPKS